MAEYPGLRVTLESLIRDDGFAIVSPVADRLFLTTVGEADLLRVGFINNLGLDEGDVMITKELLEPLLRRIVISLPTPAVLFGADGTPRPEGFVFYWRHESQTLYFSLFVSTAPLGLN
jgi:hypothetical protein